MVAALQAAGARVEPRPDGLVVHGQAGRGLAGGVVDSAGDHRVAMALAVGGLTAAVPVRVAGWEAVATSYPEFEEDYRRCLAQLDA
jgi:3-phosphoshikimate 1-carboxyvinyltransferase